MIFEQRGDGLVSDTMGNTLLIPDGGLFLLTDISAESLLSPGIPVSLFEVSFFEIILSQIPRLPIRNGICAIRQRNNKIEKERKEGRKEWWEGGREGRKRSSLCCCIISGERHYIRGGGDHSWVSM